MCRITGYFFISSREIDKKILKSMNDVLEHGGPDDSGMYVDANIGLGHKRLSIIDLSKSGHQPYEWNEYVLAYNGEMYNYMEIRKELQSIGYNFSSTSDTEVIIKAFNEWGKECIHKFRGMFAFALWNKKTKILTLCRDRIGVKPLYYYFKDDLFMFSSELKSFSEHPEFNKEIDNDAVNLYLQTGYIKSPYSIFKYCKKLVPGSFLEIDLQGKKEVSKYWDLAKIANESEPILDSEEDVLKQTESILTEAFNLRLVADVPVGVFLSGGIDSSLVASLLQKDRSKPLDTFTIGFEDKEFDESRFAEKISSHIGSNQHTYICNEDDFYRIVNKIPDIYDEPFGDSSAIPTTLVSEVARKHVKVSLSADAGDELFIGYERYLLSNNYYDKLSKIPYFIRNGFSKFGEKISPEMAKKLFSSIPFTPDIKHFEIRYPKLLRAFKSKSPYHFLELVTNNTSKETIQKLHNNDISDIIEIPNDMNKMLGFSKYTVIDGTSYLEGDIMAKVDRATMSVALESREPFLDHKIIEHALRLPDKYKIRDNESKWILRQILYKYVPKELIDRPKQGFGIPFVKWLKSKFKNDLLEMANDDYFMTTFKLNKEFLNLELEYFLNSSSKATLGTSVFWFLFILYKWYLKWLK